MCVDREACWGLATGKQDVRVLLGEGLEIGEISLAMRAGPLEAKKSPGHNVEDM